ncbi:phosphotransferase [Pseudoalteromonas sp. MEBiC 03607]|jgi:aminoglycoside/choline kinase family phosphotransferase|uniref:aminoglycoside phosphotransferase family protein n=1 Tax=unclassified Pseudoalteromonas TaxID=194690 RepID=UPI001093969F|nr:MULTISPECIES: phosphotransferase [unclassified Pseudoalteromonas]MCO7249555.1 phosphotransferase [Pseudoalteromonas sp. Ps84H-4]TGV19534.1 phosphotransferase [Pseudoalteromonas sp. MEBiC 03607]TMO45562.1 phosphotransferase [Pseudoalteromonas sp. S4389]|tara:strand:+ start:74 stop:1075 length:1002 start_codon:yes stop_codon:yes gene_type:complete
MNRYKSLQQFLNPHFKEDEYQLAAITGDASFRRYFRVNTSDQSYIVMDSDPNKLDNTPYIELNKVFSKHGFKLPKILQADEKQGFFLLSDLGNTHLADLLGDEDRTLHYKHLIKLSAQWAQIPPAQYMKVFDGEFLQFELSIFKEWLVDNFIGEQLSVAEQQMWQQACELLVNNALEQPIVTVHRDFHSRNIMRTGQQWAIIDYQDAVQGPVCYDLVSLLRDCYFKLPEQELDYLLHYAYDEFNQQQLLQDTSFAMFKRWFDLTGVQRHLKAAGIFCRLKLRDDKSGYLNNVLPTLKYISNVSKEYPELTALGQWIEHTVIPRTKLRLTKEMK